MMMMICNAPISPSKKMETEAIAILAISILAF